jgi:hypothetical protein
MTSRRRYHDARSASSLFWMSSNLTCWNLGGGSFVVIKRDAGVSSKTPSALLELSLIDVCADALSAFILTNFSKYNSSYCIFQLMIFSCKEGDPKPEIYMPLFWEKWQVMYVTVGNRGKKIFRWPQPIFKTLPLTKYNQNYNNTIAHHQDLRLAGRNLFSGL